MSKTLRLLFVPLAFVVAIVAFTVAKDQGWLSPIGIDSESQDSQVIQAIERTQEVSLLKLGIQGISDKEQSTIILGKSVPGTGEKVFLQYKFTAKLGIDGAEVNVKKTGEGTYLISVPKFIDIGFDKPTFDVVVTDGGILSGVTPDIDEVKMINEILSPKDKQRYITSNEDLLEDQTKVFYDRLITSIDPDAKTTYEFRS